jgi:hypothetical protein
LFQGILILVLVSTRKPKHGLEHFFVSEAFRLGGPGPVRQIWQTSIL